MEGLKLSIIIPTHNRLAQLQRVLTGLERQTCSLADAEVIVISDGSTDGTNEWLAARAAGAPDRLLPLTPVIQANQGVAAARNAGLARARGDIVLFIDDDVVACPQLVAEHLASHSAHGNGVIVLGPLLTPPDFPMQAWVRWEQTMLAKQYADMAAGRWAPTARQFYTGNTSLARQYLVESGGFDPAFRRAEDVELAYRLARRGLRFVFNLNAVGHHYARRSFDSWLQIPYLYGRNDVIFARDKGEDWLLPVIWEEFVHGRNPLIHTLVWLCLDRPLVAGPLIQVMAAFARLGDGLKIERLTRAAFSGIFNLRHYQGMADELGGRRAFFAGARRARRDGGR